MILKLIIGFVIVYVGWWLWRGPKRLQRRRSSPAATTDRELNAARRVLGLDESATLVEIRAAYRRIAAAVHPDRGGSTELARQVNMARDVLLKNATETEQ